MGCSFRGDEDDDDVSTYALSVYCLLYLVNGFMALYGAAIFVAPTILKDGRYLARKDIISPSVRGLAVNTAACCSGRFIIMSLVSEVVSQKVGSGKSETILAIVPSI
jgi:hypothetical protein